jgi:hypothetical protein
MRYGAAIRAIDDGDVDHARLLLRDAPSWPDESCFRDFHKELVEELQRLVGGSPLSAAEPTEGDAARR